MAGTVASFTGPITFTGLGGTLTAEVTGTLDVATGAFTSTSTSLTGTGTFRRVTGDLTFTGTEDLATLAFTESITGRAVPGARPRAPLTRSARFEPPGYDAQQRHEHDGQRGPGHERRRPADHHREDQHGRSRRSSRATARDHDLAEHVPGLDHPVLHVVAEDPAVEHDRGQVEADGDASQHHQPEVQRLLGLVDAAEDLGERQREQEAGQQLDPGLDDAQLLEQLVPVAVEPLVARLVAVVRPSDSPAISPPRDGQRTSLARSSPASRDRSGWKPWSMPHRIARDREVTPILR